MGSRTYARVRTHCVRGLPVLPACSPVCSPASPLGSVARTCEDEISRYSAALALHPPCRAVLSPLPSSLPLFPPVSRTSFQAMEVVPSAVLPHAPSRTLLGPPFLSPSPTLFRDDACKHRSRMAQAANFRNDVLSRAVYGLHDVSIGSLAPETRRVKSGGAQGWEGDRKKRVE